MYKNYFTNHGPLKLSILLPTVEVRKGLAKAALKEREPSNRRKYLSIWCISNSYDGYEQAGETLLKGN